MKKTKNAFVVILALAGVTLSAPASADGVAPGLDRVAQWNQLAMNAVRAQKASDADAARLFAMLNVAIYDAVNGVSGHRNPALVPGTGPRDANPEAAATAAARTVLSGLDSPRIGEYDAKFAADLDLLRPGRRRDLGVSWGLAVGQRVLAARANDGSSPVQTQEGGSGPGVFPTPWAGVQYRNLKPFVIADPGVHVLGPPPGLASLDYAAAFAEVALLGDAAIPAPDKLATFQFWAVPTGTAQPAGEWLKIALRVAADRDVRLTDGVRLLALLTMAMSDNTIATVGTKFAHRHWRPASAIPLANTDGNPLTVVDPDWVPRGGKSGSPEWISGHSSYSSTAATVLAGFFCNDGISFEHTTDSASGAIRAYRGFSAAAAEAGRSRVFGGLHFEFSNQGGLELGRGIGGEVLRTALLVRNGPTHFGGCPR